MFGKPVSFLLMCWLNSFYSFESQSFPFLSFPFSPNLCRWSLFTLRYRWINENESLQNRLEFIETKWGYFAGFGFSFLLLDSVTWYWKLGQLTYLIDWFYSKMIDFDYHNFDFLKKTILHSLKECHDWKDWNDSNTKSYDQMTKMLFNWTWLGFPGAVVSFFFPQFINYGLFAAVFPLYVIMANRATPVPLKKPTDKHIAGSIIPSRVGMFHYSSRLTNKLVNSSKQWYHILKVEKRGEEWKGKKKKWKAEGSTSLLSFFFSLTPCPSPL